MDNFFDKFRSGAEKAAFEADKLRRITAVQGTVRSLKGDFEKVVYQAGQVAFSLHQRQQINQPELLEACERLAAVQAQIQAREREIETIRAETYETTLGVGHAQYGRLCPNGHGPIPLQDNFCQKCGARAIEAPPPASRQCAHCGAPLAVDARFCASCGQTAAPAPSPQPPAANPCPACGAALLPGALFCAECGHRLEFAASDSSVPATVEPGEVLENAASEGEPEEAELIEAPKTELYMDFDNFDFGAAPGEEEEKEEEAFIISEPETAAEWTPVHEDEDSGMEVLSMNPDSIIDNSLISEEPAATVHEDVCPVCQVELLPEAMFCAECGHRLEA